MRVFYNNASAGLNLGQQAAGGGLQLGQAASGLQPGTMATAGGLQLGQQQSAAGGLKLGTTAASGGLQLGQGTCSKVLEECVHYTYLCLCRFDSTSCWWWAPIRTRRRFEARRRSCFNSCRRRWAPIRRRWWRLEAWTTANHCGARKCSAVRPACCRFHCYYCGTETWHKHCRSSWWWAPIRNYSSSWCWTKASHNCPAPSGSY